MARRPGLARSRVWSYRPRHDHPSVNICPNYVQPYCSEIKNEAQLCECMFCWRGMPGWPLACVSTDTVSAPTNARPISHLVCCALSWPRVVQGQVPPPLPPPSRDNMNMTTQHLPRPTVNTAHCAAAGHLCGDTRICSRA